MKEEINENSTLFSFGLIFIVVGLLICISPFFIIIGFPVYIIGVLCVSFSKKDINKKLKWIMPPLGCYVILMGALILIAQIPKSITTKDILIPDNFRGKVYIIYDQSCGIEIAKEDSREVYKIPESGVLICKNKQEEGGIKNNYLLLLPNGERRNIYDTTYNDIRQKNLGIFSRQTCFTISGTNTIKHNFESFTICNKDSSDYFTSSKYERKIDSIKYEILKDCVRND